MGLQIGSLRVFRLELDLDQKVGLNLGTDEGIKLGFSNRKLFGSIIGAVVGVPLDTYVDSEIISLEGSTYGGVDCKFDGLLDQ